MIKDINSPRHLVQSYLDDNRNVSGPSVENGLCVKNGMHSILLDGGTDFFLSTLDDQVRIYSWNKVAFVFLTEWLMFPF